MVFFSAAGFDLDLTVVCRFSSYFDSLDEVISALLDNDKPSFRESFEGKYPMGFSLLAEAP